MLVEPKDDLERVVEQIRHASALDYDLIRHVIADACTRLPLLKQAGKTAHIDRLIEAGAWCDAAIALIDIELPGWSIRRLVREDDEWFCSLTREPNMPATVDDTVDANHRALPLAILGAFLEACRKTRIVRNVGAPIVPQVRPTSACAICCDNFG